MCNSNGCGPRKSNTVTVTATGTKNISIPNNSYIHEIIVLQGATNLGASATLSVQAPGLNNEAILAFAAAAADDANKSYPVRRLATGSDGTAISGTALPINILDGGINVVAGGTIRSGGSCTVQVVFADTPPPPQ